MEREGNLPHAFKVLSEQETSAHYTQMEWYVQRAQLEGRQASIVTASEDVMIGDTILTCQGPLLVEAAETLAVDTLRSVGEHCLLIVVE